MMISARRGRWGHRLAAVMALQFGLVTLTLADEPWAERTKALGAVGDMPTGVLSRDELVKLIDTGEALFEANFTKLDGVGRPRATQAIDPTRRKHSRE